MSRKVLTAQQMREVDRMTIEELGVPGRVLMENAGRSVVDVLESRFTGLAERRIAVLCGKGNNGGDGFVIARHLLMRDFPEPRVVLLAAPSTLQGDARTNYDLLVRHGLRPAVARDLDEWNLLRADLMSATLLIDAIFGTGMDGPLRGFVGDVIQDLRSSFSHAPVVAVDLPSGMGSDTGEPLNETLIPQLTVSFTAPKWSHVLSPNCTRVGELVLCPIGTPDSVFEQDSSIQLNLLGAEDLRPFTAARLPDSHKGNYGHALLMGGARGMSGAAALAGMAALGAGAGLVTVATSASAQPVVAAAAPELMTVPLAETPSGSISHHVLDAPQFSESLKNKSVIAVGPGISNHRETASFVRGLLGEKLDVPIVIDADGLNAFEGHTDLLDGSERKLILTPHPGEMARLSGKSVQDIQSNRVEAAREFAVKHKVCVVLKGFRSLIAGPGGQVYVNPTGNAGMSTAGSGDVLTGMIAGLLAQHPDGLAQHPDGPVQYPDGEVKRVVASAVYWHGLAGDVAAARKGELSLTATDLIQALPEAVRRAGSARESLAID